MSLVSLLFEIVFWFFLAPYLLFGLLLGMLATTVVSVFGLRYLMAGLWFGAVGLYLQLRAAPDDSQAFVGLVDVIAESHIGGIGTPVLMLIVAGALLAVGAGVGIYNHRKVAV
ncbi:MAG: hypothetical protein ACREX0_08995 [Noviherbaspirillum sp.]